MAVLYVGLRPMQWIKRACLRSLLFPAPRLSDGHTWELWEGDLGKRSRFHQRWTGLVALQVCSNHSVFLCRDTRWEIRATGDLQSSARLGLGLAVLPKAAVPDFQMTLQCEWRPAAASPISGAPGPCLTPSTDTFFFVGFFFFLIF